MNEQYLDAHKFIAKLHEQGVDCTETVANLVKYAVIEDVAPVVHAHWESAEFDNELKTCSNCHCDKDNNGTTWYYIRPEWRYCPLCGAIMDEVSE